MIRQYKAQRRRGGYNPLGVGVISVGSIYYLQDHGFRRTIVAVHFLHLHDDLGLTKQPTSYPSFPALRFYRRHIR